ncbi:MAG TPA: ZIP family metal transporter [Usitatibacter sp.]|nr:ZIP family metal transporter [Usitatibacter sp.]
MSVLASILVACIAGSLLSLSLAAAVAFRVKARWIPTVVSYAVGALLGAVFLDILPHLFESAQGPAAATSPARIAAFILCGILAFFVLEKLLLWRHHHHEEGEPPHAHAHESHDAGRTGTMIVIGDSFHNFTDGIIIASAFVADPKLGVVTALAIIAHEIPQEIGDFLVLLHSGFSRARALAMNALSGVATIVGALLGYFALSMVTSWTPEILAIAAASMIYVAVADLIPALHKRTALGESLAQVAFIVLGVASIWIIHAVLHPE